MTEGDFLTTDEVAALLKVSVRQVQDMANAAELPAYRVGGAQRGPWRFVRSEIEAWLRGQRNRPKESAET